MHIHLNDTQVKKLSDISADMAQVFVASVAIPYLLDSPRPMLACFGVALAIGFWSLSLQLLKRIPDRVLISNTAPIA